MAEVSTAPTEMHGPSWSSGHDAPIPATESAPRRYPEQEGRNLSPTESVRRRCPEVRVPRDEASQIQHGHCEDINLGVAGGHKSPTPQGKGGLLPTQDQHVHRACPECDADRDVDQLVDHHWRQHLRGLPIEVAGKKRWKSGCWWNWYNDLVLVADDRGVHPRE